ncbi:MAG: hypothetical protein KKF30_16725 [Proteobacteria bacterium]|nr:hypothetical protein [Pseudomonadota bacterium]MBU4469582.1 hypothetical protein [Pseudomonadota bacterium]MCG2753260.1 hypothetical protein [Desulfobacteraceae bacterium]
MAPRGYTAGTLEELINFLEMEKYPKDPSVIEIISDPRESPILRFYDVILFLRTAPCTAL